ncbi:MAG TPA: four-carbon acid sugar kinase family protein [Saprospiraceae bacterium]|nr:four-carbon acid sugar kinase family protein [Saprospiraceae bacterium]HNT20891.1 four-carbon acid sugar kinase family protein [Saprospiraceae bacterium]
MYQDLKEKLKTLPPEYPRPLLPAIRSEFLKSGKTILVLDDDPTGTQTSSEATVITSWRPEEIVAELDKKPSVLFILTNSRSLPEEDAIKLSQDIGRNLNIAIQKSGREIVLISRSDSTLRGHFPAETDALVEAMGLQQAIRVLVPAFIEGGRYTIEEVHYLAENQQLVPVSETAFARDRVFGYKHSNLKNWVEEKSKGKVRAAEVLSVSLEDIRTGGPEKVAGIFMDCREGKTVIINAAGYRDLEVVALASILAGQNGKTILFRSSATFVPIRAGMESGRPFKPSPLQQAGGSGTLVVAGSYVSKTSQQLNALLARNTHKAIEVDVVKVLKGLEKPEPITGQINQWLAADKKVLVYTSRLLQEGHDDISNLHINAQVSDFLVSLLKGLAVRPRYILAKGGITSSDIASKGLLVKSARILGPVIPGVPVWQLGPESRFPGMYYIVFPGNVGDERSLETVCQIMEGIK